MTTFSIICIDALPNKKPKIRALERTIETFKKIGKSINCIYWFSNENISTPYKTQWIRIPPFTNWFDQYTEIALKFCPHMCTEDYNLTIHSDGFAVNPDAWTDEFLDYDYLGAIFYPQMYVGGGGFSLRSKKLYETILNLNLPYSFEKMTPILVNNPKFFVDNNFIRGETGTYHLAEDLMLCKIFRKALEDNGVKFPPLELADRFSIEHNMESPWVGKSFGFHGRHGIEKYYGIEL